MNDELASYFASNPFATHHVRPGMLTFHFQTGYDVKRVLTKLSRCNWRGQILGPHGSGKTTLLRTLDDHWSDFQRNPMTISLRDSQRRLPAIDWQRCDQRTQLIIDGFEQLSMLERWRVRVRCRRQKFGLLVTTHQRSGSLPVLYQTSASSDLVQDLAKQLTDVPIDPRRIVHCFARTGGNVRETFMLLYDEMREKKRGHHDATLTEDPSSG